MRSSGKCALLVSEEEDEIIYFKNAEGARYAVACDPIDGSSNLDAGVSVGTIFAVHKLPEGSTGTKEDILKPGTELVAAGFTMYGASAQLVLTMKDSSVNGFTLDNGIGEFILTHPNMRIPRARAIYSVNEGNSLYWQKPTVDYFNSLKTASPTAPATSAAWSPTPTAPCSTAASLPTRPTRRAPRASCASCTSARPWPWSLRTVSTTPYLYFTFIPLFPAQNYAYKY